MNGENTGLTHRTAAEFRATEFIIIMDGRLIKPFFFFLLYNPSDMPALKSLGRFVSLITSSLALFTVPANLLDHALQTHTNGEN